MTDGGAFAVHRPYAAEVGMAVVAAAVVSGSDSAAASLQNIRMGCARRVTQYQIKLRWAD